jgi:hypothetical protein
LRRDARDVVALGGHCEGVGVLASSAAFLVVAGGSPPPFMATKAFAFLAALCSCLSIVRRA